MNAITPSIENDLPPYLHDDWEKELEWEKAMLSTGEQRMRDKIKKAREKRDMNRLGPHRSLLTTWVVPLSEAIGAWKDKQTYHRRGVKPLALDYLNQLDNDTAAVVAIKTILRLFGVERRAIMALATEIGAWCENESRAAAWMTEDKDSWAALEERQKKWGSDATHTKRARIAIFNKHVAEKIGWVDWPDEARLRVGLTLIDLVVRTTKSFRVVGDPDWRPARQGKKTNHKRPMILHETEELSAWLGGAMDEELVMAPAMWPTIIPPRPWDGPKGGGYWTPFVRAPFLVRFKASHEDQKRRAIDEYYAIDMPEVYEAINSVQSTPWAINKRVLGVARAVFDMDLAIGGFPRKEDEQRPARPSDADDNTEVHRDWARRASEVHRRNALRFSTYINTWRTMTLATKLLDVERFYFPHMLDFRGRMYPVVTELSPQGHDLHRGLLTFAEGKPVGPEDAGWLAIQVANCFGIDKVSYDDRIAWVEERNDLWRAIDDNPLGNRQWLDADGGDSCWQALAAIFEWVRYLKEGDGMISSLPIRVDGTCNGLQHLSAMVRDEKGGRAVNLLPGDFPRDIYLEVAKEITSILVDNPQDPYACLWLKLTEGGIPRALTKRPVMIVPYGGSHHAFFRYTMDWLKERDPEGEVIPGEERAAAVSYLVKHLWDAVNRTVSAANTVMTWLKKCSDITSTTGKPLYWVTPCGFVVRHFYGERAMRRIDTNIDGQRINLVAWDFKPTLDKRDQMQGIAPNFVHSLDASALMTSVNLAALNGVRSLTTIHDAYGTVAADMRILEACLREGFIQTYEEDVLEKFLAACKDVAGEEGEWPAIPEKGTLDIEEVRHSEYFFA